MIGNWDSLPGNNIFSNCNGWQERSCYETLHCLKIRKHDRKVVIQIGRSSESILIKEFDPREQIWIDLADGPRLSDNEGWNEECYFSTIQAQVVCVHGRDIIFLLARSKYGIVLYSYDWLKDCWESLPAGCPIYKDEWGWNLPHFYFTIKTATIAFANKEYLVTFARHATGIQLFFYDPVDKVWNRKEDAAYFTHEDGWSEPFRYLSLKLITIKRNGREVVLIMARSEESIILRCFDPETNRWENLADGPQCKDIWGWNYEFYYETIKLQKITLGNKEMLLFLARHNSGILFHCYDPERDQWEALEDPQICTDLDGWRAVELYRTIQTNTLQFNGHQYLLLFARDRDGVIVKYYNFQLYKWDSLPMGGFFRDADGFTQPSQYGTIKSIVFDDPLFQKRILLFARCSQGVVIKQFLPKANIQRNKPNQIINSLPHDNPLLLAVNNQNLELVKKFSTKINWVTKKDSNGRTLFDIAFLKYLTENGSAKICRILVLNGADPKLFRLNNMTAIEIILRKVVTSVEELKLIAVIMYRGVRLNLQNFQSVIAHHDNLRQWKNYVDANNNLLKEPVDEILAQHIHIPNIGWIFDRATLRDFLLESLQNSHLRIFLKIATFGVLHLLNGVTPLRISIDPEKMLVDELVFSNCNAVGICYPADSVIILGGRRDSDNDQNRRLIRATLVHEIVHYVMNEVFSNNALPYKSTDQQRLSKVSSILSSINSQRQLGVGYPKDITALFFYDQGQWHAEFIARCAQVISMGGDDANQLLSSTEISSFYLEVLRDCHEFLTKIRYKKLIFAFPVFRSLVIPRIV